MSRVNRLRGLAVSALLLFAVPVFAAPFTSTQSGDWSNSATWGGAGVPTNGDDVTITSSHVVTVSDLRVAQTVTLDSTAGNKMLLIQSGGNLIIEKPLPPALTISAASPGSTNIVRIDGGTLETSNSGVSITGGTTASKIEYTASGGTVKIAGDLTFAGTVANAVVDFGGSSGTLELGKTLGSGGTIINSVSSTFVLNGTGAQTINSYSFNHFTVNKAGGTATLNGPITVNGNFDLNQGVLDDGGNQISLDPGITSAVTVGSLGVLKLGSSGSATTFPTPASSVSLAAGSAVVYQSGATQTIQSDFTYDRLYLSTMGGTVDKTLSDGSLSVNGELNIADNGPNAVTLLLNTGSLDANADISGDGTITVTTGSVNVAGNVSNSITLNAGTGTFTYDGNGLQQVLAATYYDLAVTKTGGTASLAGNATVNSLVVNTGTLDLGANILTVAAGNLFNYDILSAALATIKFNGTSPQIFLTDDNTIALGTLEINNAAGVTLDVLGLTINTALNLVSGKATVQSGPLFVDVLATVTRTSGWVIGKLTMGMNPAPARTFHVGTAIAYMPVDVDSGSAGTVVIEGKDGLHPNKTGINILNRYWDIDNASSATPLESVTFKYNQTDFSNGDETKFHLAKYDGATWTQYGDVVNEGADTATVLNVSTYPGDWVIGQRGSLGAAGVLAITSVNGGTDPSVNTAFDVDVQARHDNGSIANVTANTTVNLAVFTGTGNLGGTTSGTINAATSSITISGVVYDTIENGVVLRAASTSGDPLDYGDSSTFNVVSAPSVLFVSSINDSGPGTLRDAIITLNANNCATPCTINFTTAGNIILSTPLPTITRDDVTIDGFTAPGAVANTNSFGQPSNATLTIGIDGGNTVNVGFDVQAQLVFIKGFVIKGFTNAGVVFTGANTTTSNVSGCYIGTDFSGQLANGNAAGVHFAGSSNASAGGFTPASRNVISGNSTWGVITSGAATGVALYGNYIGTKADLSGALANPTGVKIDTGASGANIGSSSAGNIIAGNLASGLVLSVDGNFVKGNYIGIAGSGGGAMGNSTGIQIDSDNNTLGGASPSDVNYIGSNGQNGVLITGDDNVIDNNWIGLAPDGITARGNGGSGIRLESTAARNIIGTSFGNKLVFNANDGVSIATTAVGIGNAVRKSKIAGNSNRAIDIDDNGLTANDGTDLDTGANNLQNFPTISEAVYNAGSVNVKLSLNSSSGVNANFFAFDMFKADGSGQAIEYLGNSGCLGGNVFTNLAFGVSAGSVVVGNHVVATATAYSDAACSTPSEGTSELSATTRVGGDVHWINAGGGAWETTGNWNPAIVPTSSDTAYIDTNGTYTVTINSNVSVGSLQLGAASGAQNLQINTSQSLSLASASAVYSTGTLTHDGSNLGGTGALNVFGTMNWSTGNLFGTGNLVVESGGTLNINGGATKTVNTALLGVNAGGTVNWTGGTINFTGGGGVDNAGTFEIKTDSNLSDGGSAGTFDNFALLKKTTTSGTTSLSITLNHTTGTFDIQTGTMNVSAGTAAAPVTISGGASLYVDDSTFHFNAGSSMTGGGKIHIAGGTLAVNASPITIEHILLDSGNLGGTGLATTGATGTWLWTGGNMSGGGTTEVANGGVLSIGTVASKTLNNRTLNVLNGGSVNVNGSGTVQLANGGTISNGGTVDVSVDMNFSDSGSDAGITNSNLFKKTGGAGTLGIINVDFTNNASLKVLSGTLNPSLLNSTGTIELNGGSLLVDDNIVTLSGASDVFGTGLLKIAGGTLTVDVAETLPNVQLDSGNLNGTGTVTIDLLAWNGGNMSGSGTTAIPASTTSTIATSSGKSLQRTLSVAATGQVLVTGSGTINLSSGGNINNGGLFDLQTDLTINDAGSDGGILNSGTFRKSGGLGIGSITNVDFTNNGNLQVQSGTLNPSLINNSSSLNISTNCILAVDENTVTTTGDVNGAGLLKIMGGTVAADANDVFPNVELSGGTFTGTGVATIESLLWTTGTMSGTGTTTIPTGETATLSTASGKALQRTLSIANGGTVNVTGSGALNLSSGGNVANDGTFEVTAAMAINDAGSGGDFVNTRNFRSNHAGSTVFSNVTLNNFGATAIVDILNGSVDLADGQSTGQIAFGSGTSLLINSHTYDLATGTVVSGAGSVVLTAGTLLVSGNVSMPSLTQSGGAVDGSGTLTLTGSSTWSTGSMIGGGTTTVGSTGILTLSTPSAKALNNRTLSVDTGGVVNLSGVGSLNLANAGNVTNSGTFNVTVDSTIADTGFGGNFVNAGTFTKSSATGPTTFSGIGFTNNGGLVDLQSGVLIVSADLFQQLSGTLKIWLNGTTPGSGHAQVATNTTPNLAGTLEIALVGPYQPNGGDTFRVLSATSHSGDFTQPYTYPALAGGRTFSDAYDASGLLLTVSGTADLAMAKSAPSNNVTAGASITYTLQVTNNGPDSATSVTVTDTLPAGHTGINASGTGWSCNVVGDTVTCTIASLATGAANPITITANAPVTPQTFINSASVSWANDPNNTNDTGNWTITVNPPQADMSLGGGSPAGPVAGGSNVTFQFTVTNSGPQQATNVTFTAVIPAALTYNSATIGASNCSYVAPNVTCSGGTMNASTFTTVSINVTTGAAGTYQITGNVTATEGDGNSANNTLALSLGVTGSTLTVTNTADTGPGSLRQAILDSATGVCTPLPCNINFNIPAGPYLITPQTDLPALGNQVILDATTQPGYAGVPIIQLDGSAPGSGNGLTPNGTGSTVRGFSIQGFTAGLYVMGSGNAIEANYIGLTPGGIAAPNTNGMRIFGNTNTVGGTTPAQRNVVSGNSNAGIFLSTGATGNVISGNYIGTDPAGTAARPNQHGIQIWDNCDSTVIGGATTAHRNVISANNGGGIVVDNGPAANLLVQNNWIGLDATGALLGNASFGVAVDEVTGAAITANTIAGQGNIGVVVHGNGTGTTILGNSIHDNINFGIDLNGNGISANDGTDADGGGNGTQNFPTLGTVTLTGGGNVNVAWSLDSSGSPAGVNSVRVELFKADTFGDGKTLVHSACFAGNLFATALNFNDPSITAGTTMVATATSYTDAACTTVADGTSEFSNVVSAAACTPPAVSITGPTATCGPATVTLDAGPGFAQYAWSTGAITQQITVSPASTTTYSVTVTTNLGCQNSDSHTVTVNALPSVTITGPTTSCAGGNVTLDAGTGFAQYAWSTGAITQQITVSPGSTTTYSVTVTDGNNCQATDTHTVTVTANPTVTISGPTDMCAGGSVTLDAGPGYASYSWSNGATTQQILVSPAGTTTYSVTVGNGSCQATDTHTVTVNTPPTATITASGPTTLCSGNSVVLTASAGASWLWSNGATSQQITVTSSGTFSVQVSNGTCSTTSSPMTVTVNPTPVVTITGPTATCGGAPVTLDAGSGFTQYLWSNGATTQQITVSPSSTQTFSVNATDGNNCSASDSHTVTVSSSPTAGITAPATICENATGNASVAAQPGASYTWSVTNGTLLSGQTTSSIAFTPGPSGSVSISVSVVTGSCTSNGNTTVAITQQPSAAMSAPATATANQSGLVASVPATAGASYNWDVTNGTLTAGQGTNSITFTAGPSGVTTVAISVTNGSCSESSSQQVTIDGGAEPEQSDVAVTKSAPSTVQPGANIVYTIGVANRGGVDASGVVVTDNFPSGTTFVSMASGPWNCSRMTVGIRCTGTAMANSSSTITLTLAAPQQSGTIVNTVDVTSATPDANPSNNSASAATSVVAAPPSCATVPPSLQLPANGATVSSPVTFTWSAVSGATGYELWINDTLAGTTASTTLTRPVVSGTSTWFVVARLATRCAPLASATRTFTVAQATNCAGNGAPAITSPASGATVASPTTFTWTAVPNAIGYRLMISVGGVESDAGTTDGATSLTVALPVGSVTATVQALFAACPVVNSAPVTVNVPRPDPCATRATASLVAPANNAVLNGSSVNFEWTPAANASGYRVWVSIDGAAPAVLGATTAETTLHGTIPRGDVIWFVESLYEGCASTESQPRRFVIPSRNDCTDTRPELLAPARNSDTSNATVNFTWSSVPNAVEYELWASVANGTPSLLGTTTSTMLTHIVPPGRIDWFVRAVVDRCPARDSQTYRVTYTPPSACAANQRPMLAEPLDGTEVTSPVSFAWNPVPNAASYDLFIIEDEVMSVLATTTSTEVNAANLAQGHLRWFVRANFGGGCSPLDSTDRSLEIVPAAAACRALEPPSIAAPGQISGGVPFVVQWTPVNGATAYQLQLAGNASFGAAQTITTAGTSHALVRSNGTGEPLALYARVRTVDGRCTPPSVSTYGPASAMFILPATGTEGAAPAGTSTVVQFTIPLGAELAGSTFVATPKQPWLTVNPASGVVGPNGSAIIVTANTAGLPPGTSLGGVSVSISSNAGSVATNNTITIPSNFSVSMVTPVTPSPKDTPPPDALIIPAVAHAGGINAQFQSDVRVSNTSAQPIEYLITFTPSGDSGITQGQQSQFSIDPGRTVALDDILKSWFGTGNGSAMGTLEIRPLTQTATSTSSNAFTGLANLVTFASSRTFNLTANGTFGQYIPAIPFANFIGRQKLLSLQQIAQSNRYRTNLGIVEGSGNSASLVVRVFGASGQYLTEFNVDLRGGQHMQLNSFLRDYGVGNLNDGRVEIEVISGDGLVTAYASVLDNETSDPLLVTPVTLSDVNAKKWVMPGVADLVSGFAAWQTDMRLFNAGQTDADVTMSFYSQGGGEPKVRTLTIKAGEVRQFDRTLATLFEITNDGGAVHIDTSEPARLIATARTYNQTGTGTYGQFISAVTPGEAAGIESRPLQLLQVEESERFRSNIGLVEVTGKPVTIEISAIPPDAKFSAVTELELRPNEFRQLGSLLRSMGLDGTYNARVTVRVTEGEGRVTAYASVIDMLTNDPTYVPAQ